MPKPLSERLSDIPGQISANVNKVLVAEITETIAEACNEIKVVKLLSRQIESYKEKEASYAQQAANMATFKEQLDQRETILGGAEDYKNRTEAKMAALQAEVSALRFSMSTVFGRD